MLVLTRKKRETIYIGDSIVIRVVGVRGGKVQIGIEAPRETRIVRAELPPEAQGGDQCRT